MDVQSLTWTLLASFVIVVLLGPIAIPLLRRFKFGQAIRAEGPMRHQQKTGTPTMGGIIFLLTVVFVSLRFSSSPTMWILLVATLGFAIIGFLDDVLKILRKRNLGLTAKQKLTGQVIVVIAFFLTLYFRGWHFELAIPFMNQSLQLGIFYPLFLVIFMVGFSNAVNLTDGLDGLAAGTSAIAFTAFAFMAWWNSQWNVSVFSISMVGALLGFLVYNRHKARIFMGDTGSLGIGGALAAVAVLTHSEIWLLLIGLIFIIETLSVMIQVISFQAFGRRVFKMSPIHHHFELLGWSEWRVVLSFWVFTALCSGFALYLFLRA